MPANTIQKIGSELHSLFALIRRSHMNSCLCDYRRQTGLTEMQSRVIGFLFLNRNRDIFQKDIEKEFSIRRATVSVLLQSMEVKKLIRRESVPRDARLKKVLLTPKAEEMAAMANRELRRFEEVLREGISEEELKVFFNVTKKIRANIENNLSVKPGKGAEKPCLKH